MKYSDPPNTEELISSLKSLSDEEEILSSIKSLYPDWIKGIYSRYCDDYSFLQDNWEKLCMHLSVTPKKILTVEMLSLDVFTQTGTFPKLLSEASEILTLKGYCIRREREFERCLFCDKAVPTEKVYEHLKKMNPLAFKYSPACSACLS